MKKIRQMIIKSDYLIYLYEKIEKENSSEYREIRRASPSEKFFEKISEKVLTNPDRDVILYA